MVGSVKINNTLRIQHNSSFSVSASGKRRNAPKRLAVTHEQRFTVRGDTHRAERDAHLQAKEARKQERLAVKQQQRQLQEQADRNGLLGINQSAEAKIPHLIPQADERLNVERTRIHWMNVVYMLLFVVASTALGTVVFEGSSMYFIVVAIGYVVATIMCTMISTKRAKYFRAHFSKMTGYSLEQLEILGEARVDNKILKCMKVLVDERQTEEEDSYISKWSLYGHFYDLLSVLKNNVRSKHVESFIQEYTLHQVKDEREAEYAWRH
jgi:uncharacterized membrane protein (DUF485 family)